MKKTLLTPPSSTSSSSSSTSKLSILTSSSFTSTSTFSSTSESPMTSESLSSSSESLSILLADDNIINLQLLQKSLQMNFNIKQMDIAYDGYEALEFLQHRLYDIILLDIDMPRLNGIETTRFIRVHHDHIHILDGNRNTPIVAVTTNDSIEAIQLYRQVGMDGCISKPVIAKQLKSQLLQFLDNTLI